MRAGPAAEGGVAEGQDVAHFLAIARGGGITQHQVTAFAHKTGNAAVVAEVAVQLQSQDLRAEVARVARGWVRDAVIKNTGVSSPVQAGLRRRTGSEGDALAAARQTDGHAAIGINLVVATAQDGVRVIAAAWHPILVSVVVVIPRIIPISVLGVGLVAPPISGLIPLIAT